MKRPWLDVADQIWEIVDVHGAYMDWLRDKPLWAKIALPLIGLAVSLLIYVLP